MTQKWDSARVNSNVLLTNGDLTATETSVLNGFRPGFSTEGFSTGKFYWETTVTFSPGNSYGLGLGGPSSSFADEQWLGLGSDTLGIFYPMGDVWNNNTQVGQFGTAATGNRICHALDLNNGKYWVRVGISGNWNDDAAGDPTNPASSGNFSIPAGVLAALVQPAFNLFVIADAVTAFFAADSWSGIPPSGFTSFDTSAGGIVVIRRWNETISI